LPTPEFVVLDAKSDWMETMENLDGECFVKPANEGSSLGMRCVNNVGDLEAAYHYALAFDREVIAERRIIGKEFTVSIVNDQPLPVIELKAKNQFYDYEAKYISGDTQYHCPSSLSAEEEKELQQLALEAFNVLGCSGWGRVDFMQDTMGNMYLLEANTVPGMTTHSLVPMAATVAGLSFDELVQEILVSTFQPL